LFDLHGRDSSAFATRQSLQTGNAETTRSDGFGAYTASFFILDCASQSKMPTKSQIAVENPYQPAVGNSD
jgi:hypothetical protein